METNMNKLAQLGDLICTYMTCAEENRASLDAAARARGIALTQLLAAGLAGCLYESYEFRQRHTPLPPPWKAGRKPRSSRSAR
jgi:hypothetical protein